MPIYKRLPRQRHLKQPDEFVSFVDKFYAAVSKHQNVLFTSLLVLAVGFLSFKIWSYHQESTLVSLNEKRNAALSSQNKVEELSQLFEKNKNSKIGWILALDIIGLNEEAGDKQKALDFLSKEKIKAPSFFQDWIFFKKMGFLLDLNKIDEAKKELADYEPSKGLSADYALLLKAYLSEVEGQLDQASQVYQEIASSPMAQESVREVARGRFLILKLKGNSQNGAAS